MSQDVKREKRQGDKPVVAKRNAVVVKGKMIANIVKSTIAHPRKITIISVGTGDIIEEQ